MMYEVPEQGRAAILVSNKLGSTPHTKLGLIIFIVSLSFVRPKLVCCDKSHPFKLNTIDIEAWSPFPPMFGGVSGVAEPGTYSATAGPSHQ